MSNYIGYRDGGKTNEQGLKEELLKVLTPGNPLIDTPTSMAVTQRGAGANMSVDVAIGDGHFSKTTYSYWGWSDAVNNVVISAADPTNPRRDIVVAYIDLSVVSTATTNNLGALKFKAVTGTPAGSPADPNAAAIQASVGAGNPYLILARVSLPALAVTVVNGYIADLRTPIAFKGRLFGGTSNTSGHTVPNIADDTVALLNAVQTFTNKTFTSPVLSTPTITAWDGWQSLGFAPNTVTANGQRSYNLVFNTVDLTSLVTNGNRLKLPRTVAPPTQCTLLDGSTQYWNRASGSLTNMAFTNNFVVSAWVKMTAYGAGAQTIASRFNNTSGWSFEIATTGQVRLVGYNAGGGNFSEVKSYQSIPIGQWVHVTAQLDMATFTATTTTSYVMIDGIDVPATVARNGTNPTALVQAGNLEIGSQNAGSFFFGGEIAQLAIYGAKVTQSTILNSISQTLTGSETNVISVYTFNGNGNDTNVNANHLTANSAVAATTVDSPMNATEYAVVMSKTFSVNTTLVVQVPEGYSLPVSGGINTSSYSTQAVPFAFPADRFKWIIEALWAINTGVSIGALDTWTPSSLQLTIPIGAWAYGWDGVVGGVGTVATVMEFYFGLANTALSSTPDSRTVAQGLIAVAANNVMSQQAPGEAPLRLAIASTYKLTALSHSGGGTVSWNTWAVTGSVKLNRIYARNAYV